MLKQVKTKSLGILAALLLVGGVAFDSGCKVDYDRYLGKFQHTWTPNGVRVSCVAGGKQCIKGTSVFFGFGK